MSPGYQLLYVATWVSIQNEQNSRELTSRAGQIGQNKEVSTSLYRFLLSASLLASSTSLLLALDDILAQRPTISAVTLENSA